MTKKDYIKIAKWLQSIRNDLALYKTDDSVILMIDQRIRHTIIPDLIEDNPRFDSERFIKAIKG